MPRKRHSSPQRRPHARPAVRHHDTFADQPLIRDVRAAMREGDPIALLALTSSILATDAVTDAAPAESMMPTTQDLVTSLLDVSYAETTALLTALAALTPDEALAGRIGAGLAHRPHPLPPWLRGLREARIDRDVFQLSDTLGDDEDYFVTVTIPGSAPIALVVLADNHLGGAVKDAFLVPLAGEDLLLTYRDQIARSVTVTRPDPAVVRATLERGIADGDLFLPPLETESWPQCRPALEWALRLLPAGGVATERREWSEQERTSLIEAVLASPEARDLAHIPDEDATGLLSLLIGFAIDRGVGDPLVWSTQSAARSLEFAASKVLADAAFLELFPDALAVLIPYGHRVRGISEARTREVLAVLPAIARDFADALNGGPTDSADVLADQLAAALGLDHLTPDQFSGLLEELGADDIAHLLTSSQNREERRRSELADLVGGPEALAGLSTTALPDEPLDLTGVPDDVVARVSEWVALLDTFADSLGDVELRTAQRRFVAAIAQADPAIFRRRAAVDRGAAAVAWLVGRANRILSLHPGGRGLAVRDLMAHFELTGSVSQRAEPLLRAIGGEKTYYSDEIVLGRADLLVSARRRELASERDRLG